MLKSLIAAVAVTMTLATSVVAAPAYDISDDIRALQISTGTQAYGLIDLNDRVESNLRSIQIVDANVFTTGTQVEANEMEIMILEDRVAELEATIAALFELLNK